MDNLQLTRFQKLSRYFFFLGVVLFLFSVAIQIFTAGLAIFVMPTHWLFHITYIHLFGFNVPIFLLLFAYLGRLPRWAYLYVFGLMFGVFVMYFTANITSSIPWVGALHPVMAIFLFYVSYQLFINTAKLIFIKKVESN